MKGPQFFLLLISLVPAAANSFTAELYDIESQIESLGVPVIWVKEHSLCARDLLGAYIPAQKTVFICQSNHNRDYFELVGTLKHEGWHAAQHICNRGRAALPDHKIRLGLTAGSKSVLHQYHPKDQRSEAEARVIEQFPTSNWIKGFRAYCSHIQTR